MLLTLVYHRATGTQRSSNTPEMLDKHFAYIADNYQTKLPGDKLGSGLELCLTFDDAYCDFYYIIYPLLQKYGLKALLSVPTGFIAEKAQWTKEERLKTLTEFWSYKSPPPTEIFCSWQELKEMDVAFASHTVTHPNLTQSTDLINELKNSKERIEQELGPIETLVLPYGRGDAKVYDEARKHYKYVMRIGHAMNFGWKPLIYRCSADSLYAANEPFLLSKLFPQLCKGIYRSLTNS
ncbi:MAG: polysaccharide deacetylase family protein [Simkaniaceae bacterium]|nr:polysaccharide deacetylase family protein [Simkaniaceae bacterium]